MRSNVRAPGLDQWNMYMSKTTKITEKVDFQLRADAFNVFSHRQFTPGNATVFQPSGAGSTYSNLSNPLFLQAPKFFGRWLKNDAACSEDQLLTVFSPFWGPSGPLFLRFAVMDERFLATNQIKELRRFD